MWQAIWFWSLGNIILGAALFIEKKINPIASILLIVAGALQVIMMLDLLGDVEIIWMIGFFGTMIASIVLGFFNLKSQE